MTVIIFKIIHISCYIAATLYIFLAEFYLITDLNFNLLNYLQILRYLSFF